MPGAVAELIELAFRRLYNIAQRILGRRFGPTPTLHATALVNEGVLRLYRNDDFCDLTDANHFYARFSLATKHALIDYQRNRQAEKRGPEITRLPLDVVMETLIDQLGRKKIGRDELQEGLDKLRQRSPRCAEVIELRYFGGMTNNEIAQQLGVCVSTVESDHRFSLAHLKMGC